MELPLPLSIVPDSGTSTRVLVTGWRFWPRQEAFRVHDALVWAVTVFLPFSRHLVVVDGACPYGGVDLYAHEWATGRPDTSSRRYPAKVVNGKLLGPQRNAEMVAQGADVCLGFPELEQEQPRGGTWDCIRKARKAGIPTFVIPYKEA